MTSEVLAAQSRSYMTVCYYEPHEINEF